MATCLCIYKLIFIVAKNMNEYIDELFYKYCNRINELYTEIENDYKEMSPDNYMMIEIINKFNIMEKITLN